MPWWVLPVVMAVATVVGSVRLIARGRRVAAGDDPALAVRGATLTVLGTTMLTSGLTAAAVVAMLSYALR
jgi:hypothetical protein